MTPLFKLPVTGGVLVGHENRKCVCKEINNSCSYNCNYKILNKYSKEEVIGVISNITEEQAREWGFRSGDHMTWDVMNKLNEAGISDGDQDFSKILLILIKYE